MILIIQFQSALYIQIWLPIYLFLETQEQSDTNVQKRQTHKLDKTEKNILLT